MKPQFYGITNAHCHRQYLPKFIQEMKDEGENYTEKQFSGGCLICEACKREIIKEFLDECETCLVELDKNGMWDDALLFIRAKIKKLRSEG